MSRQFLWTAADGITTIDLTDHAAGYRVQADATTGLNAPPYQITTAHYAGIDGVDVLAVAADGRDVVLGLLIQANDEDTLTARADALTKAMRPKAGPGTLTVRSASGRVRTLSCYYASGLEGVEARGSKLPGSWWKFAVHLLAADPWWYGPAQTVDAGLGAGSVFFPILPMRLSPSTVQGQFTINLSDSDDGAWPVWTITGPGSNLVLTNNTTGLSLSLDVTLAAGETLTVDTRPLQKTIRKGDGTNLLTDVTPGTEPQLWPLVEGINQVTAALTGATASSRISGQYQARYAGA